MLIFKRTGTAEVQNTSSSLEFGRNLGNLFQLENNPIYSNFWFFDSGNWLSLKQVCVVPIVGSCPQPAHLLTPGDLHHDRTRLPYDKKSDEGSNSVRMRHENSGASTVVEN